MAFSGDHNTLLNSIEWTEAGIPLRDFTGKHPVPNIVKITKGQYRNVGVSKSVHSELYLHSVRTTKKVLAESVKVKSGRGPIVSEQKYSLPITYQGWFELLSEDGKAIKALQSVQELVKVFPQSCLVRENIKAFVPRESGDLSLDRMRVIIAGEMLTLVGEMFVTFPAQKTVAKRRLLRCIDQKGDSIYLAYEQKGLFSPVAGQANISGVHSIKGLLEKFRLPILVRLVHGTIPSKIEKTFTGTFRLMSVYSDEMAFVSPLRKDSKMVPISTREPLKVVATNNFDTVREMDECKYIQTKCNTMIASYLNSIHILFSMPDPSILERGKEEIKKLQKNHTKVATGAAISEREEEEIFEEIDGIYQYVRDGKMPVKKSKSKSKRKGPAPQPPSPNQPGSSGTLDSMKRNSSSQDFNGSHEDDKDYWEEPIYQPIGNVRRSKRDSVGDPNIGEAEATIDFEPETSTIAGDPQPPVSMEHLSPVQNLRAVMKKSERPISGVSGVTQPIPGHVKEAIKEIETNYDVLPPPVPPKHYDETDIPSTSPAATILRSKSVNSQSANTSPTTPVATSSPMVSVLPKSSNGINGNGMHPPHMAVARSDGAYANGGTPSATRPPSARTSRFSNLRKKFGIQGFS